MPQSSRTRSRNRRSWKGLPTRLERDLTMMRSISDFVGLAGDCLPVCGRAGRCAAPGAPCFDANPDYILDYLEEVRQWRRFEGPREPHEADARDGAILD